MRYYMADTGKQVASWLGIDIDGLSRRVAESLLSIADRSVVERERFEEDLEAARADYCEGEMAAPGLNGLHPLRCSGDAAHRGAPGTLPPVRTSLLLPLP